MGRGKGTFTLATDKRSAWPKLLGRDAAPNPVYLDRSKGLYSSCQLEKRTGLLWRCTEAYGRYVDLAKKYCHAPLKSPGPT